MCRADRKMLSQATIEEKYKETIKEKMTGKSTADNFYIFIFPRQDQANGLVRTGKNERVRWEVHALWLSAWELLRLTCQCLKEEKCRNMLSIQEKWCVFKSKYLLGLSWWKACIFRKYQQRKECLVGAEWTRKSAKGCKP